MKLEKFKEKDSKKIEIVLFTITCILLISGVILYRTFAIFEVNETQNIINGKVEDPGDIYFAFYKQDENGKFNIQKEMPTKKDGYVLDESQSYCGVTGKNDSNITVSISEDGVVHVNGVTTSRTKCNLYFVKGVYILGKGVPIVTEGDGLYEVTHAGLTGTIKDEDFQNTEYRYAGNNPNNYVTFNDETWRIIGLVNVMTSEDTVEQRVKIINNDGFAASIASWDTSAPTINSGRGVNEWSQADLMKLLNPGYDEEQNGGSLYYNSSSGNCYNAQNNQFTTCEFKTNGLKDRYKDVIEEVTWNTGSNGDHYFYNDMDVYQFYEIERSSYVANASCTDKNLCNDGITRKYIWKGKVGLVYPSDYGFASSEVLKEGVCKTTKMYRWDDETLECNNNDWLYMQDKAQWTITPCNAIKNSSESYSAVDAFSIRTNKVRDEWITRSNNFVIRPVVYLKEDVIVLSGKGNSSNPFMLAQKKF